MPRPWTGDFSVFAIDGRGVRHETGYSKGVLREIWRKHEADMPREPIYSPDRRAAYYYLCFVFIHMAPSPSHSTLLNTPHTGPISQSTFRRRIVPRLIALAAAIDEICKTNKLDAQRLRRELFESQREAQYATGR